MPLKAKASQAAVEAMQHRFDVLGEKQEMLVKTLQADDRALAVLDENDAEVRRIKGAEEKIVKIEEELKGIMEGLIQLESKQDTMAQVTLEVEAVESQKAILPPPAETGDPREMAKVRQEKDMMDEVINKLDELKFQTDAVASGIGFETETFASVVQKRIAILSAQGKIALLQDGEDEEEDLNAGMAEALDSLNKRHNRLATGIEKRMDQVEKQRLDAEKILLEHEQIVSAYLSLNRQYSTSLWPVSPGIHAR